MEEKLCQKCKCEDCERNRQLAKMAAESYAKILAMQVLNDVLLQDKTKIHLTDGEEQKGMSTLVYDLNDVIGGKDEE